MAEILSFRNKDKTASGQDFLTDETEKLSFRMGENGAVSLGDVSQETLPDVLPDPAKDWGNQELADLFRVRQLLSGAGVPVDTMRGVTDEGDPWFVYCHLNGDVFIHMARIDGFYVLDSPNVHRPLTGRNFNELIADFTSDALPSYAKAGDSDTTQRVVKLERGGKIRLHPSAMLAALIWTLFMASEELVMLAEEEKIATDDDLLDFSDVIAADFEPHIPEMETANLDSFVSAESSKTLPEDVLTGTSEVPGQMREAMGQQGMAMHQNAYAMGLSTIAIVMGFMSEAALHDNQRKVLDGLNSIGFAQYVNSDEAGPELEQIAGENSDALLDMLAEFLGLDLSLNTETADANAAKGAGDVLSEGLLHLETVAVEAPIPTSDEIETLVRKDAETDLTPTPAQTADAEPVAPQTLIALAAAEQEESDAESVSDLFGNRQVQLEEFDLGQTTVLASFDITKTDAFSLSDYIIFDQDDRVSDHRAFDDQVQSFIDYVQAKNTEVGIVTVGNEIIMIDRSAFDRIGEETYSFSWETDEGQIISLIGLRSEFQQFDLIA